ncbi:MAG: hypothetical protein M3353_00085, partial [Actinomycetota bacterium]|nr:hypothetical protein [Actinomycetota bacterium]
MRWKTWTAGLGVAALAVTATPATADHTDSAANSATSRLRPLERDTSDNRITTGAERIRPLRLDTDEGRFDRGTDNQGWWATHVSNSDGNDNYFVGSDEGNAGIYRNFFTFDLSRQIGRVSAATLIVRPFRGAGDATEVLGLFHV